MSEIRIEKMRSFTDLPVWQEGHKLVLLIFRLAKNFPPDEITGLSKEIKRSALSVTSNITEGFGRNSYTEKIQFYTLVLRSIREIQNHLLIARDMGYIDNPSFEKIAAQALTINKLCNELVKGESL